MSLKKAFPECSTQIDDSLKDGSFERSEMLIEEPEGTRDYGSATERLRQARAGRLKIQTRTQYSKLTTPYSVAGATDTTDFLRQDSLYNDETSRYNKGNPTFRLPAKLV